MTAFGGSIKLTGESEYRQALQKCTQNLQTMSSALKTQTIDFSNNDKSMKNNVQKQKELTDSIKQEQEALNKAKSAYAQYSVALQTQTTRYNALSKEYKNAVLELDKIKVATGESSSEYKKQAEIVDKLGKELVDSTESLNENKTAMANLKSEINNSNKVINNAQKELNDLGEEAKEAGKDAKEAGDGFTIFKGILADLGSKAIQTAISGLKKLSGTLIDVGKQSVNQYARYEQLVGGVETLFKDSSDTVQKYAEQAYKTAGLSANDYMEQITSFSASLIQSLGGDTRKAAEYGNLAIIDMSDNANKMGTSMQMIQNAYQGFAKQNYTMLDNLKLGYGGTKTEMQRLIKDANALKAANGEMANLTIERFGDVVEAIHLIQTQMGITGTTSKEAASTIEGSTGSMKASWQNLLVAIADDNKDISKAVDEFVGTVTTNAKNLVPRIKTVVNGIKKLINSIVTEVFPRIKKEIPQLAPLIDVFDWFVKNKNIVVNAIKLMVTAFAVNKIMSFTKSLSDTTKNILALAAGMGTATTATTANTAATAANTVATTAGATATGLLTKAVNLLNAAWKANPIGVVVGGITALIGVMSIFKGKSDEATEAAKKQKQQLEELKETVDDNAEAWDNLKQSQQDQVNNGMSELSYYQNLYDELQGLIDANGKVQEGYEGRASFIVSTLNDALGTEIQLVDGVIQKNDELKDTIDEVMAKKKAQIILDSQEALYTEAINNRIAATKTLNELETQLNQRKTVRNELEQKQIEAQNKYNEALQKGNPYLIEKAEMELKAINMTIEGYDKETANIQANYDKQLSTVQEYAYNIGQYETNMALFHEGKYDEMSNVNWQYVKDYGDAEDAKLAMLEDSIKEEENWLEILQGMRNDSNKEQIDKQIETSKKKIANLQDEMKQYQSTTKSGLNSVNYEWSDGLDDTISLITGKNVEFKEGADGNVQAYVNGVKVGEPKTKDQMAQLVTGVIGEINKKKGDADVAGQNLLDGVNSGISNRNKQSGVFGTIATFGGNLLSTLKRSLKEQSPSKATKEMGQYLLEGLGIGIDNEESKTLRQVSNVGQDVVNALQDELNQGVTLGNIGVSTSRSRNSTDTFSPMVDAFKEALSQMKIELDDEVAGKFVESTVARAIYS